ncbi:MAG: hypothetical protein, partial [Olavius algarvensis Gamma 1 endosymbiont]
MIKRGNFHSQGELRDKLLAFIDYFNATMANPFNMPGFAGARKAGLERPPAAQKVPLIPGGRRQPGAKRVMFIEIYSSNTNISFFHSADEFEIVRQQRTQFALIFA